MSKAEKMREDLLGTGPERNLNEFALNNVVLEMLSILTDENRKKVFNQFCRSCCVKIERLDWSKQNYCDCCSPDPKD